MCNPTSQPPRRDLYELETSMRTADNGPSFLPESDRKWAYIGTETHYGYTYHLWQNAATKRRYAWEVETYRAATKETAA